MNDEIKESTSKPKSAIVWLGRLFLFMVFWTIWAWAVGEGPFYIESSLQSGYSEITPGMSVIDVWGKMQRSPNIWRRKITGKPQERIYRLKNELRRYEDTGIAEGLGIQKKADSVGESYVQMEWHQRAGFWRSGERIVFVVFFQDGKVAFKETLEGVY